jgi:hypothetical protein
MGVGTQHTKNELNTQNIKILIRKIQNFLTSRYPKTFFNQSPISQALNYSFMQKKL